MCLKNKGQTKKEIIILKETTIIFKKNKHNEKHIH